MKNISVQPPEGEEVKTQGRKRPGRKHGIAELTGKTGKLQDSQTRRSGLGRVCLRAPSRIII